MKNISRFDLGMIISFVVVAILGAGAWYYLSGMLTTAQADAAVAAGEFDTYSKKEVYLPTTSNVKILQNNIALMSSQLDPLVKARLQSPQNQLDAIQATDNIEWKHQLDDEVHSLNNAAKIQGITVPDNFYYGFSRYLNTNPTQESTIVLSRQLVGIKEIADLLIKAPVQGIINVRRTYEEDPAPTAETVRTNNGPQSQAMLQGRSQGALGGVYTAYPFEVEFDAKTEGFRKFVNDLMQSPYVFVIRSVLVQNSKLESPRTGDLATMAGTTDNTTSLINSSPGAVAAAQPTPTVGVQYLFGNETLHIRVRIDLIDWHGLATEPGATRPGGKNGAKTPPANPASNSPVPANGGT